MVAAYFDYNATTPLKPSARVAINAALDLTGNPSSIHSFGRDARVLLEQSRAMVAQAIGVRAEQITFTSGGTESNHLALRGSGQAMPCLISAIEHDCSLAARPDATRIPVDNNGIVDEAWLDSELARIGTPALVSIMLANNETGVIQPIVQLAKLVHAHGGIFHCDAAQALGKIPVNATLLGVDLLSLSAHKCGGPKGVGALYVSDSVKLAPLQTGGGQENRRRAGTENLSGIAGFAGALETPHANLDTMMQIGKLRDAFEAKVIAAAPDAIIYSRNALRLPNTTMLGLPGMEAATQLMSLDLAGFAVSTGSACASGKVTPSHVLTAMGCDKAAAKQAIRISSGWNTTTEDYNRLAETWLKLYQRRQAA